MDTILRIIQYIEINRSIKKDMANNVNALVVGAQRERAPRRSYTNKEYIDQRSTTHFSDKCWVKHLELCSKYTHKLMRTWRSNQNPRKASEPESQDALANQDTSVN